VDLRRKRVAGYLDHDRVCVQPAIGVELRIAYEVINAIGIDRAGRRRGEVLGVAGCIDAVGYVLLLWREPPHTRRQFVISVLVHNHCNAVAVDEGQVLSICGQLEVGL